MSYEGMSGEQFVDYLIDEGGLRAFVDQQYDKWPVEEWDWTELARRIAYLSERQWQPTPGYVETMYRMQLERQQAEQRHKVANAA